MDRKTPKNEPQQGDLSRSSWDALCDDLDLTRYPSTDPPSPVASWALLRDSRAIDSADLPAHIGTGEIRVVPGIGVLGVSIPELMATGRCRLSKETLRRLGKKATLPTPRKKPVPRNSRREHHRFRAARRARRHARHLEKVKADHRQVYLKLMLDCDHGFRLYSFRHGLDWRVTKEEWDVYVWPVLGSNMVSLRKWIFGEPYTLSNIYLQDVDAEAARVAAWVHRERRRLDSQRHPHRRGRPPSDFKLVVPREQARHPVGLLFDGMRVRMSQVGMLEGDDPLVIPATESSR